MKNKALFFVFIFLFLGTMSWVFAETESAAASINGKVIQKNESICIPGVVIQLFSHDTILKEAISNDYGEYLIDDISPGSYRITFKMEGFKTISLENIELTAGQILEQNVKMELKKITEPIVLDDTQAVILKGSPHSLNLATKDFNSLPNQRQADSLATLLPGANLELKLSGLSVDGASALENIFFIDDMEVTDIKAAGIGQTISLDIAEEVQFQRGGYQAEHANTTGGTIRIITRSGSNEFHGGIIGYYSGSALSGKERNSLQFDWSDYSKATYYSFEEMYGSCSWSKLEIGFNLSGRVIKDKCWFYVSFLPIIQKDKSTVNGYETDHTLNINSSYWNALGKFTAHFSDRIRWNVSVINNFFTCRGDNYKYIGMHIFQPMVPWVPRACQQYDHDTKGFDQPNWSVNTNLDIILGDNSQLYLSAGYFRSNYSNVQTDIPDSPCYQFIKEAPGGYHITTNMWFADIPAEYKRPSGWMNYSRSQALRFNGDICDRLTLKSDLTTWFHLAGDHQLKMGVHFVGASEEYENTATQPIIFLAWDRTFSNPYTGIDYGRGKYGYYAVRSNDETGPYGNLYHVQNQRWALYLQDSWSFGRFTAHAGVRSEAENFFDVDEKSGQSPIQFGFLEQLAPRIGLIWDALGNSNLRLFAHYGVYYQPMRFDLSNSLFSNFQWQSAYYSLNTYEWDKIGINGYYPGTLMDVIDFSAPELTQVDPDLKPMSQREISVGLEANLWNLFYGSLRVTNKHLRHAIEDMGVMNEDGFQYLIVNPGYSWSRSEQNGGKISNIYPETPKAKREYWGVTLALHKPFSQGWMAGFSYTWSRLSGNYSGLINSDQQSIHSLYQSIFFDTWFLAFNKNLEPIDGPLATDRPHVIKLYGSYRLPFGITCGAVIQAMSGTPVSEQWSVSHMDSVYELNEYFPFDRGNLGRTPFFWFANLYLEYSLKLKNNQLQFSATVDNLFNTATAQKIWQGKYSYSISVSDEELLSKNWQADDYFNGDPRFLKEYAFYNPIAIRLGIDFLF
jgi:hypothetical protein